MHLRGFFIHDHYRYEIIFSTFASAKRKQNRIRQKKHEEYITRRTYHPLPPLEQKSLRCICQHRAVCHHRLPAQKRGRQFSLQTESCWNCRTCRMQGRERSAWRGKTEGRKSDIGIPLGSSSALTSILTELGTNRHILFETQVIRPCGNTGGQDTYSLKQKRTRGTDYRKPCSRMTSCTAPAIRTSVFIHELNPRKI